jgi:DNA-directed RNA polymerase subunit M/transcription elongation factor TFIIS
MILAACPYCYHGLTITEEEWGDTLKCPACGNFFDTDTPAAPALSTAPPAEPLSVIPRGYATRLTAPHDCHQCREPFETPTGQRRSTVLCPVCHRKTSVYAVLHHCPWCDALLESPARRSGALDACPVCRRKGRVPHDVLLAQRPRSAEGAWFSFPCPACSRGLEAQTGHAGETAVCPHCLRSLQVPPGGEALPAPAAGPRDVAEAVGRGADWRCPSCHLLIPGRAATCPYCVRKC